jgi:N-acetylneuraminate synthase
MSSPVVHIGDHPIGDDHPITLVAEIGINANGDRDSALKLIEKTRMCDWDGVKFQKRHIDSGGGGCYTEAYLKEERDSPWGTTQLEQKQGLEFDKDDYQAFIEASDDLFWFASPWDWDSVDFLEDLDIPAYKIASPVLLNGDLLKYICNKNKPVILSTGMVDDAHLISAINVFYERVPLVLLHCVSTYPCPLSKLALNSIEDLKEKYEVPVGYSGHEQGTFGSLMAAQAGACLIERHITLDTTAYGSDQSSAMEPIEMNLLKSRLDNDIDRSTTLREMYNSPKSKAHENEAFLKFVACHN